MATAFTVACKEPIYQDKQELEKLLQDPEFLGLIDDYFWGDEVKIEGCLTLLKDLTTWRINCIIKEVNKRRRTRGETPDTIYTFIYENYNNFKEWKKKMESDTKLLQKRKLDDEEAKLTRKLEKLKRKRNELKLPENLYSKVTGEEVKK
jgi:hypothetical protein